MAGQYGGSWWNPIDNIAATPSKISNKDYNLVPGVSSGGGGGYTGPEAFQASKVDPYLDNGWSYEDIARDTSMDVGDIRAYTDRTRPGYGTSGGGQVQGLNIYGSGGSGSGGYSAQDLALLDQQMSLYNRLLQSIDSTERDGLQDLETSEIQARNNANLQRERQLEDFGTKRDDFTRGQEKALNTVGDNSRTLRGSLMRRLGLASGGGSAFDVADDAVARDASKNRASVQETYGENFRNLGRAEKRGAEDFQSLLDEIKANRQTSEERFRVGILGQRQGIEQSRAQIAADRAGVLGGNQMAASQPYMNNYMSYQDQVDRLPSQFNTKVTARDLNPQQVSLRDYMVDRANIGGGAQQQQYSPYSQFLKPQKDDEEKQLGY